VLERTRWVHVEASQRNYWIFATANREVVQKEATLSLAARIRSCRCETFNVTLDRLTLIPSTDLRRFARIVLFLSVFEILLPFGRTPTVLAIDECGQRKIHELYKYYRMINGSSTSGCTVGIIAGAYRGYVNADIRLRGDWLKSRSFPRRRTVDLFTGGGGGRGGHASARKYHVMLERDPFSAIAINRLIV